ncbi:MAG: hypothetical protein LQ348_005594 [Seirophora lacunosa]|nr:MAG: hypothetical protein LQ344_000630 [Seirophora lacunosa]KAI4178498.1 MAG: hypothetical protein LQ348_005594 [Seirophora lacunosa]
MPVLKRCDASFFKGYLIWYHNQFSRAKRLNTFESVWKGIRQLYYDTHGVAVRDSVGKEVAKFLNSPFCTDHDLIRGSLPKHTVGYNGILGALYYHWIFDTETFPTERDRVQLAFFILLLAYTGSRPGAIVESDIKGIRRTNEALNLTMDQKLQARNQPELQQLERRRDALTQGLRAQFAKLKDGAATPEFAQRQNVMGQLYRGRARAEKEHFQRVLREFHDTADLNFIVS